MQEEFRYVPVTRRDQDWGLYVTGAGRVLNADPDSDWSAHPEPYFYDWDKGRQLSSEYMVLYHPHSSLRLDSEVTQSVVIPPGNFIVFCPGIWHRYRPVQEPTWTQYWVSFSGSYANHLVRQGFLNPKTPISQVGLDVRLLGPYRRLLDQLRSSPPGLSQLLAANVMEILGVALALSRGAHGNDANEWMVRQAKSILAEQVEQCVDMQELASTFGVGYDQFRHVFKQLTGFAPYQYHLQLRIGRAKQLLTETDLSIKEIAALLKFDDSYHFSKRFKQYTGTSPSEFRKAGQAGKPGDRGMGDDKNGKR